MDMVGSFDVQQRGRVEGYEIRLLQWYLIRLCYLAKLAAYQYAGL